LKDRILSLMICQTKKDVLKRLQAETAAELDALLPAILDKVSKEYREKSTYKHRKS
jgi:hypothetical protein